MTSPTVEFKLEEILVSIQKDLNDLKVSQAEIKGEIKVLDEKLTGQIKALDEKVTGIGKRVENQEFLNRGVLITLIVALIAGAAKIFGWLPLA
ncbi:hypothetical protein IQ225_17745 [Synechocystis salina LEGE 06155]|nr:hypothetical protein [Synechocystis salina LEGE 06155]